MQQGCLVVFNLSNPSAPTIAGWVLADRDGDVLRARTSRAEIKGQAIIQKIIEIILKSRIFRAWISDGQLSPQAERMYDRISQLNWIQELPDYYESRRFQLRDVDPNSQNPMSLIAGSEFYEKNIAPFWESPLLMMAVGLIPMLVFNLLDGGQRTLFTDFILMLGFVLSVHKISHWVAVDWFTEVHLKRGRDIREGAMDAHGFSMLVVYAGFIVFLGVVFILLAVKLWRGKNESFFAFGTLLSMIIFLVSFNLLNPDGFIAKKNIDRFNQGGGIDAHYLGSLSVDAVPTILNAYDRFSNEDKAILQQLISIKKDDLKQQKSDWQSYNVSRDRALREIDNKILAVPTEDPRFRDVQSLDDLSEHSPKEIKNFFETYKLLENKQVSIGGFENKEKAIEYIEGTREAYSKE
jgi:hypothetical protein